MEKFQRGEMSALAFRAFRVPMGVYEQRQEGRFMVRVRVGAGMARPFQLRRLAELSLAHGDGILHVTTRQDLQIHDVPVEGTAAVQEKLLEAGLSARGGGGNTVRNVTASPRALVCDQAPFDVTPYAVAVAEYLLQSKSSYNLPRKFKIAFSCCPSDCALASVNDLGFFAHVRDGREGFAVYAGGGLGPRPRAGVLVEEFIAAGEVFAVAETVKRLFDRLGDRVNKHRARLRYVLERLGPEEFAAEYRKERDAVRREGLSGAAPPIRDLAASCLPGYAEGGSPGPEPLPPGVWREKQPGRFTLHLRLSHGQIPAPDLVKVAEAAERFGLGLVLATQQQDLLIPAVPGGRVAEAREFLKALSVDVFHTRPKIVACAGAATCKLGLCLSPFLADAIDERLREAGVSANGAPGGIRISGCPNSCGNHCVAGLGFEGKALRRQGRLMPCYEVLAGGRCAEGGARFGQRLGTLPAKAVPAFVAEAYLSGVTAVEDLRRLVAAHGKIPSEAPGDWFVDFGASTPFSLAGRGPGECGAGVLDLIRVDLTEASESLRAATSSTPPPDRSAAVYRGLVAAARALLPVFGLEARKDRETFEFCRERLVAPGWVKPETQDLLAAAMDWRLGDRASLEDQAEAAQEFARRVEELFGSLDANLQFRAAPLKAAVLPAPPPAAPQVVDLRGVACPMNFVKAKIALERVAVGKVLEVLVDDGEPVRNVPASMAEQGQEVQAVTAEGGHFRLRLRRTK
jgi:sulfite reductase (ferredoxin)